MFCVVYEFIVPEENTETFQTLWREITLLTRDKSKGLGSRLHQSYDQPLRWIAYAQWPDQATWQQAAPVNNPMLAPLVEKVQVLCDSFTVLHQLNVVDDLLVKED